MTLSVKCQPWGQLSDKRRDVHKANPKAKVVVVKPGPSPAPGTMVFNELTA